MVSRLQEVDRFIGNPIHKTVFLSNASGPTPAEHMLQGLWLSWTIERIPHDGVDKIKDS